MYVYVRIQLKMVLISPSTRQKDFRSNGCTLLLSNNGCKRSCVPAQAPQKVPSPSMNFNLPTLMSGPPLPRPLTV